MAHPHHFSVMRVCAGGRVSQGVPSELQVCIVSSERLYIHTQARVGAYART